MSHPYHGLNELREMFLKDTGCSDCSGIRSKPVYLQTDSADYNDYCRYRTVGFQIKSERRKAAQPPG